MIANKMNSCAMIDLENYTEASVNIHDIAAGLSKINRYAGQTIWPFSVAQHSVYLSYFAPVMHRNTYDDVSDEDCLLIAKAAMLHDSPEGILGEITTPAKRLLHVKTGLHYDQVMELPFLEVIFERFNVPIEMMNIVKIYDSMICYSEMPQLYYDKEVPNHLKKYEGSPQIHIERWTPEVAEARFLARFNELFTEERKYHHA